MRVPEPILTLEDLNELAEAMTEKLAQDIHDDEHDPFRWVNLITHHTYRSLGLPENALIIAREQDAKAKPGEVPVWESDLSSIIDAMEHKIVDATMRHHVAGLIHPVERIRMLIAGEA